MRIEYDRPGGKHWTVDDRMIPAAGDVVAFGLESYTVQRVVWVRTVAGVLESLQVVMR